MLVVEVREDSNPFGRGGNWRESPYAQFNSRTNVQTCCKDVRVDFAGRPLTLAQNRHHLSALVLDEPNYFAAWGATLPAAVPRASARQHEATDRKRRRDLFPWLVVIQQHTRSWTFTRPTQSYTQTVPWGRKHCLGETSNSPQISP